MSPARVLEPTYDRIRRRLMEGDWPPGYRLDTGRIAAMLDVSTSPVRDSLNRLAGERFVDFTHGCGFHVPRIEERQLVQLLELNLLLLTAAISCETFWSGGLSGQAENSGPLLQCFRRVARASCNDELIDAIERTGGRLAPALRHDHAVIGAPATESDALERAIIDDDRSALQQLLRKCHEARIAKAGAYIALMRTTGADTHSPL